MAQRLFDSVNLEFLVVACLVVLVHAMSPLVYSLNLVEEVHIVEDRQKEPLERNWVGPELCFEAFVESLQSDDVEHRSFAFEPVE